MVVDIQQIGTATAAVLGGIAAVIVAIRGRDHDSSKDPPDSTVGALEQVLGHFAEDLERERAKRRLEEARADAEREKRKSLEKRMDELEDKLRDVEHGRAIQASVIEQIGNGEA